MAGKLPPGTYYTDGSGTTNDERSRRCGWGIAWMSCVEEEWHFKGGLYAPLGECRHTVPRAELAALVYLVQNSSGIIEVWSDCKYVVDGFAQHKYEQPKGPCAELWCLLGQAMQNRVGQVTVYKVKAHATVDHMKVAGIPLYHYLGNTLADVLAKQGAEAAEAPQACFEAVDGMAWLIQARITSANILAAAHVEEDPGPVLHRESVKRKSMWEKLWAEVRASGHSMEMVNKQLICHTCRAMVGLKGIRTWLRANKCNGPVRVTATGECPACIVDTSTGLLVGKGRIHSTHTIAFFRGLYWCWKCGFYAQSAPGKKAHAMKLRRRCLITPTDAGAEYLAKLRLGKTPKPDLDWPEPWKAPFPTEP